MSAFPYTKKSLVRELLLIALALVWLVPFYLLVNISLKQPSFDVYAAPFDPPESLTWGNYSQAWGRGTKTGTLGQGLINSMIITCASVAGIIILGSVAAYVLARRVGKATAIIFGVFGLALILPIQLGIIPLFSALNKLGLIGSYASVILYYIGTLCPLAIFMYVGFMRALPRSCEEAAQVDGASPARIFVSVIFPLLRPATGTVGILAGLIVWNDFFTPLIFLGGSSNATLPVIIYSLVGGFASQWSIIFAAITISILPLIVVFFIGQRQLMRSYAGGETG